MYSLKLSRTILSVYPTRELLHNHRVIASHNNNMLKSRSITLTDFYKPAPWNENLSSSTTNPNSSILLLPSPLIRLPPNHQLVARTFPVPYNSSPSTKRQAFSRRNACRQPAPMTKIHLQNQGLLTVVSLTRNLNPRHIVRALEPSRSCLSSRMWNFSP